MQSRSLPSVADARSPAGAEVRHLRTGGGGNLIHASVPPGQVNRATVHATVRELWYVLSGEGLLWRKGATGEQTTRLAAGVCVDVPVGTAFQYRSTGPAVLEFLCVTMPPWPGDTEASDLDGPWTPTAPPA